MTTRQQEKLEVVEMTRQWDLQENIGCEMSIFEGPKECELWQEGEGNTA